MGLSQSVESFGGRFIFTEDSLITASESFYVTGIFRHPRNTYNADSIRVGDIIVDCGCNAYTVDTIYSILSSIATLRITPQDTSINDILSCTGGILRANSPPNGTYTVPASLPDQIADCIQNYNFANIASGDGNGLFDAVNEGGTLAVSNIQVDTSSGLTIVNDNGDDYFRIADGEIEMTAGEQNTIFTFADNLFEFDGSVSFKFAQDEAYISPSGGTLISWSSTSNATQLNIGDTLRIRQSIIMSDSMPTSASLANKQVLLFDDLTRQFSSISPDSLGGGDGSIYTADGTLTGDRTIDSDGYLLLNNGGFFAIADSTWYAAQGIIGEIPSGVVYGISNIGLTFPYRLFPGVNAILSQSEYSTATSYYDETFYAALVAKDGADSSQVIVGDADIRLYADTLDATGVTTFLGFPSGADGNGLFDADNEGDTIRVNSAYFTDLTITHANEDTELIFNNEMFDVLVESQAVPAGDRAVLHLDTLGRAVIGVQPGTPESYVGFDLAIGNSVGLLVQLADVFPDSGQILVAGADSLFRFADMPSGADGNGLIDALPAGDVTINAANNALVIDSASYILQRGTGSLIGFPHWNWYNFMGFGEGSSFFGIESSANGSSQIATSFEITGLDTFFYAQMLYTISNDSIRSEVRADKRGVQITGDTLDATGVTTFLGFPSGSDSQTLSTSNDSLTISGGNTVKLPITELLRDSVTTTTMTIDLETRYQKVVQIDMATATNLTLTINNPTDAGVYTFHFIGTSGTDNVTWPAAFLDAAGTALGTDALTTGTMYTCYYSSTDAKYYCK